MLFVSAGCGGAMMGLLHAAALSSTPRCRPRWVGEPPHAPPPLLRWPPSPARSSSPPSPSRCSTPSVSVRLPAPAALSALGLQGGRGGFPAPPRPFSYSQSTPRLSPLSQRFAEAATHATVAHATLTPCAAPPLDVSLPTPLKARTHAPAPCAAAGGVGGPGV